MSYTFSSTIYVEKFKQISTGVVGILKRAMLKKIFGNFSSKYLLVFVLKNSRADL